MSTATWTGLEELKRQLRELPANLRSEAGHLCEAEANAAAVEIRTGYPVRTGDLRDKVSVERVTEGAFAIGFVVKSASKIAYIFENGTQARRTSKGWNRGRMAPGRVFIPVVAKRRRVMYANLKAMLVRYGFTVTGDV